MRNTNPTRRRFVGGVAAAGAAALAGCGDSTSEAELSTPVRGDPEADVTVAVYSDFRCPHCARYAMQSYPNGVSQFVENERIRYEHHDFPIPVSDQSRPAANAARAVQYELGDAAFWTVAEGLFEGYSDLGPSLYGSLAEEVGADPETIKAAASEGRYAATIDADKSSGQDRGVTQTPTIFVDGEALSGYGAKRVTAAIEDAL
ncbi:DsbA family protein [Halococcoides cellulosivorans]|uniref:Thioredoxin-like fold domain-containing protein n=1 Tax=Halococcoides cellulosivorans TaxID=1679096 RepID=A0A2R4WYM4_9EURY|nr:thioredoxin domain-containing protein [Halococcoides cellulosivorans]AWB26626.1 hypothetical protein HARCEL1_02320 [Halococcoides cellulosivorans]